MIEVSLGGALVGVGDVQSVRGVIVLNANGDLSDVFYAMGDK